MSVTRFHEYAAGQARVDRDGGWLRGVKLLGAVSRNGRRYTHDAMAEAAPLYNGKKVYLNHPRKSELDDDRSIDDCVGVIENARFERGAIYGDVRLRQHSRHYAEVLELAESFSGNFGFSHVADGESRWDGREEVVEKIAAVFSVDLVTEAATAAGMYESLGVVDAPAGSDAYARVMRSLVSLSQSHPELVDAETIEEFATCAATAAAIKMKDAEATYGESFAESARRREPVDVYAPQPLVRKPFTREHLARFAASLR